MTETNDQATVVGGYARQSDDDPEGIALQWRIIGQYARERGWHLPEDPAYRFSDDGVSGTLLRRPGYDRLKSSVNSPQGAPFTVLIIRRPDRLGRWQDPRRRGAEELYFADRGVRIVYANDTVERVCYSDASDPRVAVQSITDVITSVSDAQELGRLRERSLSRRREYAIKGHWVFGSVVPYASERWVVEADTARPIKPMPLRGTVRSPNCRCRIRWKSDSSPETVREIFRRVLGGESFVQIARVLNDRGVPSPADVSAWCSAQPSSGEWSHSGLRKIVANPIYFGALAFGRSQIRGFSWRDIRTLQLGSASLISGREPFLVRDYMESALVSEAEWWRANEIISGRDRFRGRPRRRAGGQHLFSGLVRCSHCCSTIIVQLCRRAKRNYRYYLHRRDNKDVRSCPNADLRLDADHFEASVEEVFFDALTSPELVATVASLLQRSIDAVVSGETGQLAAEAQSELNSLRTRIRQTVAALSEFPESSIVIRESKVALKSMEAQAVLLEHRVQALATQESRWSRALGIVGNIQREPQMLRTVYANADHFTKRAMLRAVIDELLLDGVAGRLEVRLRPFMRHADLTALSAA